MTDLIETVARAIDDASDEESMAFMNFSQPLHPFAEKQKAADIEKRMRQARAAIAAVRGHPTSES